MKAKIYRYLSLVLSFLMVSVPDAAFAVNYQWIQNDWQGGASTTEFARHDPGQNGQRLWNKFYSKDPTVSPTVQGLTVLTESGLLTDTVFQGRIKSGDNVEVINVSGAYLLKIKDYPFSTGDGRDGSLIIDGKTAANSTDGRAYPRIAATPANLTVSVGGTGTLPSGTFYYSVVAYNSVGESTPISVSRYNSSRNKSMVLIWDPVKCADGYRIYGRLKPPGTFGLLREVTGENTTTYTDTGADIPNTSKLPPSGNTSNGAYIVSSDKNYTGLTIRNCGAISAPAGTILPAPSTVTVSRGSGNGPYGTFYYVVTAVDSNGLETKKGPEQGLTVYYSSIIVSWSPVTGASGYRVYRRPSSGSYTSPSLVCSTTSTSCTDSGAPLSPGVPPIDTETLPAPNVTTSGTGGKISNGTYYYALTAIDMGGIETTYGSQKSAAISYGTNTASVNLSWSAVSRASGYRVYRTTTSGRYNSPALVCSIDDSTILSCADTLKAPMAGAPPGNYYNAMGWGIMNVRVNNELLVRSRSAVYMNGNGYPGGDSLVRVYGAGRPGSGPGAGIDRGSGAGYGSAGSSNTSNTGIPGNVYGDSHITINHAGSGGASGSSGQEGISGRGGVGGGAIRIGAGSIRVIEEGEILSDGENGGDGSGNYGNGGGGGSGGSITVAANSINFVSGAISSSGGMGGIYGSSISRAYERGGSGGAGRIRIAPYSSLTGNININPAPLTGSEGAYESASFELDTGGVSFSNLSWDASVPSGSPLSTLRFQIATNKDNSAWNFIGPDGSVGSYYSTSDAGCNTNGTRTTCQVYSGHNGDRYLKYKAYFKSQTINPDDSRYLKEVSINYLKTRRVQSLVSSPYDTTDPGNRINRFQWTENISTGSDVAIQIRTCQGSGPTRSDPCNRDTWGPWYGPRSTTFSAPSGTSVITAANAAGFTAGSRVTLTDVTESGFLNPVKFEIKKIGSISGNTITLDSKTAYVYGAGSILTDVYTDPGGTEVINSIHMDGTADRWPQYRLYLFSDNAQSIPSFLESRIDYRNVGAVYQPDGVIEGAGDNVYGGFGSGAGGSSTKDTDPGVVLRQPLTFGIRIQNDGSIAGVNDKYAISWNTPSDISGSWSVLLNDGAVDLTSPVSVQLNAGAEKSYTMKVTPSLYAPADSTKDIILNVRSESDYARVDSIRAAARIKRVYRGDGLIDSAGDNLYDPNRTGGGGSSAIKEAGPGDTVNYSFVIQNEGNIQDTYAISLRDVPPIGWIVIINDGSKDYDITDPSAGWTTPAIPPPPYSGSAVTYTVKVIPKGEPAATDIILNIYSNGGKTYVDSLTARLKLRSAYKVDGIIYGYGYNALGEIENYGVTGPGCGTMNGGDNVYGVSVSGNGGCAVRDIPAGSSREVTVGIQNEGNIPGRYEISWNTPAGWSVTPLENGSLSSPLRVPENLSGNPPASGKCADGSPCYNPGEAPFFTFKITTPASFTSGSMTVIFDIKSREDNTKLDSVKAIINSRDITPPASRTLSIGSKTATSVQVSWTAPGDDGTSGTAASYDLRYSTSPVTDTNFALASKVSSCKSGESSLGKPKSAGGTESCTVSRLFANTDYYFALKTTDEAGNISTLPASTCSVCPAKTLTSSDTTKPGTITDLVVTDAAKDTVTVCWTAPADDGTTASSGPATGYDLRYSTRYIVDDGISPGAGQVTFSSAVLAQDISLPKSPGEKECYVISVKNEINTGGGIKDDRTRNARFYFAIKALDEARNKSLISTPTGEIIQDGIGDDDGICEAGEVCGAARALTPLITYAYNMVSVPYVPSPNTPADVLGDDVGTPLYVYHWDSRGPNITNGCYDGVPGPYSNTGEVCKVLPLIKEGLGYFLWVPARNVILDVPSGSTQSPAKSCVYDVVNNLSFTCYELPLQDGWNMVGMPFDREINLSNRDVNGNGAIEGNERGIYVRKTTNNDVDVATFQTAVTARNWMDNDIFTYNGVNYTYEICDQDRTTPIGSGCPIVIQPWKAYWIRVHGGGGATFELLIPQ